MSIESLDDRRPKCCYCGESEIHPDYTCPRIERVIIYPDATEVVLKDYEYEIEVTLETDDQETA